VLLRVHAQLVEGVMPDLLHVVPVGDDALLDGILEGEVTTPFLRLVANVQLLPRARGRHISMKRTEEHACMLGNGNDANYMKYDTFTYGKLLISWLELEPMVQ
jgi:hypothetical protein